MSNKDSIKPKVTVTISMLSCISLIVGASASAQSIAGAFRQPGGNNLSILEYLSLGIEGIALIITALLLLIYLIGKSRSSKLYKSIRLIFLAGLVVGYAYYVILGFDSPGHKFNADSITLLALPNLLAFIFGVLLIIPVRSKSMSIVRVSLASANALVWLLLSLFQLSMAMSWGLSSVKFGDILSCLLFIGISLLFIVFAIIEGGRIAEPNDEK